MSDPTEQLGTIPVSPWNQLSRYFRAKLGLTGQPAVVGQIAPWFEIYDLDGKRHTPERHYDKVIVLDFCGTWCDPCQFEAADWARLYDDYRNKGLMILSCFADNRDNKATLYAWRSRFNINHPLCLVPSKVLWDFTVYPAGQIPLAAVIRRDGAVSNIWRYYHPAHWYEANITPLLLKK